MPDNLNILEKNNTTLECGAIKDVVAFLKEKDFENVLIIYDHAILSTLNSFLKIISDNDIKYEMVSGPKSEPDFVDLDNLLLTISDYPLDCIVGIGGGSVLDLTKIVSVLLKSKLTIDKIIGKDKIPKRTVGLILAPTTAGTGSEATIRALITEPETKSKKAVESDYLLADQVFLDPELTVSMPPTVTAYTGMDALTHCIEAYTNKFSLPEVDNYALEGMRLIGAHLENTVKNSECLESREAMLLASYYGGLCLGPVNTAAVHALAYPLGTRYGIPHGIANALMLPHVMKFNAPSCPERFIKIGQVMGLNKSQQITAEDAVDHVKYISNTIKITQCLSELNIPFDDIPEMAKEAMAIERLMKNNPRNMSLNEAIEIYRAAY